MAYNVPTIWTRGATPTHTQLNADLIASPLALRSLFDASVKVYRNSDQTISNNARTPVNWDATVWDVGNLWTSGNDTRLIAPVDGIYLATIKAGWDPNNAGRRGVGYTANGIDYDTQFNTAQSGQSRQNGADLVQLEANDFVEMFVYQSSGGNLDILGGATQVDSVATLTLVGCEADMPRWTDPRTWGNGDYLTPWLLKTHVADNLEYLRWMKGTAVKVSMVENLSISSGQRASIPWDVEEFQVGAMWTGGAQFTAPVDGWYGILLTVEWRSENVTSTGAVRGCGFRINDYSPDFDLQMQSGVQEGVSTCGKSMVWLKEGQTIELYAYHDADQSLVINGLTDRTRACVWLQAA